MKGGHNISAGGHSKKLGGPSKSVGGHSNAPSESARITIRDGW